jgi:hypothetical protein
LLGWEGKESGIKDKGGDYIREKASG